MDHHPPPPSYQEAIKPPPPQTAPPQRGSQSDERTPLFGNSSAPYGASYPIAQTSSRTAPRSSRDTENEEQSRRQHQRHKTPIHGSCWKTLSKNVGYIIVGACLGATLFGMFLFRTWTWDGLKGEDRRVESIKVGVVGAGPAGIAAAYTLSKLDFPKSKGQKDIKLEITIFEQNSRVGGRLVIPQPPNNTGTLYHELHAEDIATSCLARNILLTSRAKAAGIDFGIVGSGDESTTNVLFSHADVVIAVLPRPRTELGYWAWVKLLWRYGLSVSSAAKLPDGTMSCYRSMLSHTKGIPYESAWSILLDGGMTASASDSANERLKKNGIEEKYVEEIVRPQVRRQTGNELEDLSDLALSIALEREYSRLCLDGQEGVFQTLMKSFVDASKAVVRLESQVTGLKYTVINETKSSWIVESTDQTNSTPAQNYELFDHIILATPFNSTRLGLKEVGAETVYEPAHITFISSTTPPGDKLQTLFPYPSDSANEIYELSYVRPIWRLNSLVNTTYIYKIISKTSLDDELNTLFGKNNLKESVGMEIENAWAKAIPRSSGDDLGSFAIEGEEGLWGMGNGEGLGGGVEWSWVLGEAVAGAVGREIERQ